MRIFVKASWWRWPPAGKGRSHAKFFEQVDGVPLMLSLSESYIGTGLDSAWILNLSEVFAKLQGRARLSYHGFSDQGPVNVLG